MDMKDVRDFIAKVGWGMLGSSDGQVVGVRPMGGLTWFDQELWCATSARSDKVQQLGRVPYGEYCFAEANGNHLRIAGPCRVSTDVPDKAKLYEAVPVLAKYFPDPTASDYVVIRMKPDRIRMMRFDALEYEEIPVE